MATTLSTESRLSVLPVELIIYILNTLDFHSLLACARVCRLFHMLVHDSAALQYCIQLEVAGMEDGPPNTVSPAERLDKLRQYKAAWDALKWVRDETVDMTSGDLWELYGGVLAQCDRDKNIKFRQMPSDHRGIEGQVWSTKTPRGIHLRDFAMDPSQDLLVLIENPRWGTAADKDVYRIHLRNLRTGEVHPFARVAIITHKRDTLDFLVRYTLQVSGDYLGILFHGHEGGHELFIVDWKTGQVEMRVIGDGIRSFAFFTDQLVMIGVLSTETAQPRLLALNFKDAPPDCVPLSDAEETEYVWSFYFPELTSATIPLEITIQSNPAPTWMPNPDLQIPFFTARNERLYVLTIWVQRENRLLSVVLFVPSSTLISRLGLTNNVNPIPWEDWGPKGTRMMLSPGHSQIWVCYVFGNKFVVYKRVGQTSGLQVYDFNQLALQQALVSEDVSDVTKSVISPSVIPSHGVFVNDVHTSLPYRIGTIPLQMNPSHNVMCSEDSLIIVQTNERQFRILTF